MERRSAAITAGLAVMTAQATGGQYGPTPNRPRTTAWYAALRKPSFTPPGPVFGLAWTALDGLLGYAGYRLLSAPPSPRRRVALLFWALNLLGVAGFSYVLFGRKRLGEATGVTAAMLLTAGATVVTARRVDKPAALATLPLAVWVTFAAALQEEVWRKNTKRKKALLV